VEPYQETSFGGKINNSTNHPVFSHSNFRRSESWVRVRAEFALGFLQHPDSVVAHSLAMACTDAYRNLSGDPTPAEVMEMHTTLFAIGDCFGAVNVDQQDVYEVRDSIREALRGLMDNNRTHNRTLYPVSRAVAYVLTFTAQPRRGGEKDIAEELLRELRDHPDTTTRSLSRWALENRIDETTGDILPLVHAKQ
jgi:hypothetical protein